jgi:hypothetical protein
MGKLFLVLAPVGVAVTFATQVLMVIVHYAMKVLHDLLTFFTVRVLMR